MPQLTRKQTLRKRSKNYQSDMEVSWPLNNKRSSSAALGLAKNGGKFGSLRKNVKESSIQVKN
jgi:hypothetical protein